MSINNPKRSAFYNTASASAATSQRPPKRAPLILDDRQRGARRQKWQAQFLNGADALGSGLVGLFPVQLRTALGIAPDDSDDMVKNKIVNGMDALDSGQTADLFTVLVNAIQRASGDAQNAMAKAKDLFPQLLSMASPSK